MPGIFGLIITDPEKVDGRPLFHVMKQLLFHKPWYKSESFVSENVFLGSVSIHSPFKIETISFNGNEYTVLIDGHIYSISGSEGNKGPRPDRTIPEQIVELFVSEGTSALQKIAGNYSVAIYNSTNKELIIFNDKIGPKPLYYAHLPGMIVFSPEVKAISFLPDFDARLNWKGIADFLNYGYVLGEDTFFESVKSFPSAGILTVRGREDQIQLEKYFYPGYRERDIDFQTAVDECMHKLTASINEKLSDGDNVISPISGGLDSRIILGVLASSSRDVSVKPITYGQKFSYEYKNAKKVCTVLGLDNHDLVEMGPRNLLDKYEQAVWLSEGMNAMTNAHLLLIPDLVGRHYDTLLNGIYGGPTNYSAEYYTHRHLHNDWDLHQKVLDIQNTIAIGAKSYEGLFHEKEMDAIHEFAYSSIYKEFQNHLGASNMFCNQRDAFFIGNRMRHGICRSALYRFFWEMKLPLSNYSLYDFYLRTPPKFKLERSLLKAMIMKYYPELARIKDANTNLNLFEKPTWLYTKRKKLIADAKYYLTRASQGLLTFYDTSTYAHYPIWIRKNRETQSFYAAHLLSPGITDSGIFDEKKVSELFARVKAGGIGFYHLTRLTTFAIWFSLFILKEGTDQTRALLSQDTCPPAKSGFNRTRKEGEKI